MINGTVDVIREEYILWMSENGHKNWGRTFKESY